MNSFSLSVFTRRLGPRQWTCTTCKTQAPRFIKPAAPQFSAARRFASATGKNGSSSSQGAGPKRKPRRALLFASTSAAVGGVTALAFVDDIKGTYEAAERSGRVVAGLGICINEYVPRWEVGIGTRAYMTLATEPR